MKLRAWVVAAALVAGVGSAFALGKNGILTDFLTALQTARAGFVDAAVLAKMDAGIAKLQEAPGVGQFDKLGPDLSALAKCVGALGTVATDPAVAPAVTQIQAVAQANILGRSAQAGTAAADKLGFSLKLAKVNLALGKINAKADTTATSTKSTVKKLKAFAKLAKKADKIYAKYD